MALVGVVVLTKLSRYLVFRLKPLQEMRKINREQDKIKWKQDKYPPIVKANQKVGLWTNIVFFALMLPFFVPEITPKVAEPSVRLFGSGDFTAWNDPAAAVRGPKHVVKRGKTPVLSGDEARQLLEAAEACGLDRSDGQAPIFRTLEGRWRQFESALQEIGAIEPTASPG